MSRCVFVPERKRSKQSVHLVKYMFICIKITHRSNSWPWWLYNSWCWRGSNREGHCVKNETSSDSGSIRSAAVEGEGGGGAWIGVNGTEMKKALENDRESRKVKSGWIQITGQVEKPLIESPVFPSVFPQYFPVLVFLSLQVYVVHLVDKQHIIQTDEMSAYLRCLYIYLYCSTHNHTQHLIRVRFYRINQRPGKRTDDSSWKFILVIKSFPSWRPTQTRL